MQPPTVLQVTEDSRKRLLSGGGVPPAGSPVGIPVVPGTPVGGPGPGGPGNEDSRVFHRHFSSNDSNPSLIGKFNF